MGWCDFVFVGDKIEKGWLFFKEVKYLFFLFFCEISKFLVYSVLEKIGLIGNWFGLVFVWFERRGVFFGNKIGRK